MTEQENDIMRALLASLDETLNVLETTYKHSAYYMMMDYQANDLVNNTENWLTRARKISKETKTYLADSK